MVEQKLDDLTEHEAELYDRQIRLWGLESQKRLRAARILLCGLNGLGAEVAKNVILSGIRSITFMDDRDVSEVDVCSQFLLPHDSIGQNRAEASLMRAQVLNPMVEIRTDKGKINEKSDEFFDDFDVVVLIEVPQPIQICIDNICRLKEIKFFAGDLWGMFGYSFADLQEHHFTEDVFKHKLVSKSKEAPKSELVSTTVKRTIQFPALEEVVKFDYQTASFIKKLKRTGPSFIVLKVIQMFRETEGRDPNYKNREADFEKLLNIRDKIAPNLAPDAAFIHVFAQISPAAAIVGGEIAQEVIKAVSKNEAPHMNIFLFDPETCCGFVETIGV